MIGYGPWTKIVSAHSYHTGRRHLWICLALSLLASGAPAQVSDSHPGATRFSVRDEPITPIPAPPDADPLKLALGERLFEDERLSRNNARACSSCHDTRTNGAGGNLHDMALDGQELSSNTNTVFNAALSFRLNWEGTFRTFETQAEALLDNPKIMGTSVDEVVQKLSADPKMVQQFRESYGHGPDRASLLDAIATYERSLLTPGSRFDRWLEGDAAVLSAEEQNGYQLFKSFGCISCHQGVNVGGNLFERHGVFPARASPKSRSLRVASLRNVAATPPYFHYGRVSTLEGAVSDMGRTQLDRTLSAPEIKAIVAFLRTLTGTYRGHPVEAPR
ncbi:MAG: cytochrome c peroxidase [Rhodospirillaceae bacterium]|nr:cytochrome c peroxidase [Rhodospirillaceae bacterium]